MGLFKRQSTTAGPPTQATAGERPIDLARFEALLAMSVRLRDLGVDHETIQRRAAAEGVSWNDALEAIDRERNHA